MDVFLWTRQRLCYAVGLARPCLFYTCEAADDLTRVVFAVGRLLQNKRDDVVSRKITTVSKSSLHSEREE